MELSTINREVREMVFSTIIHQYENSEYDNEYDKYQVR